ncbi:RNA pseudouridine synthase [Candidatus Tenderia electrophaga]|jgi:23S rRNA pseudouridine1911/1915/1917 synthase|uniref:Pseudouridine synthase n=1 Tax=Candidatus Tenderia electrophaga TaxID=1748243 RepID=A0A0S2TCK0_9GAMM|nr:RNA pseudouridine synthase [Candidatus Tenderia electrophaga]
MSDLETLSAAVPAALAGQRLDQVLAQLFPDYSRARLQQWIKAGQVQVDGKQLRPKDRLLGGEQVAVQATAAREVTWQAQPLPLNIVYEDEHILVIDKPAGLVVHPASGNPDGTLVNALLNHAPELDAVPRAGIVHRLDKETSGLLVVARTLKSQKHLVDMLQARVMKRQYQAVICGVMPSGGTVEAPIGRHPVDRKRMAVVANGKPAVTHYRVIRRFRAHSHIRVDLDTGRTHQIRVHMAHIRHPLVGDPVYGQRLRIPPDSSEQMMATLRRFRRQALHAARLGLEHPASGEPLEWQAPLPDDMVRLLEVLQQDADEHA